MTMWDLDGNLQAANVMPVVIPFFEHTSPGYDKPLGAYFGYADSYEAEKASAVNFGDSLHKLKENRDLPTDITMLRQDHQGRVITLHMDDAVNLYRKGFGVSPKKMESDQLLSWVLSYVQKDIDMLSEAIDTLETMGKSLDTKVRE